MIGITTYFKIAGFLAIVAIVAGCIWYYKWSQEEMQVLRANVIKIELALEQSERALDQMRTDVVAVQVAHKTVSNKFKRSRQENSKLKELLGKHDLGFLAQKKPGLIGNRANKGTNNSNRCFEIASGSPLTQDELNATKPSQINSSCPSLANPNYKAKK